MIKCDAIKYAYRQSKDGFVVAFVIHPQEMPVDLANADIGSQWQLSLVPLDEHGNPETERRPSPTDSVINDPQPASEARIETPARATTPTQMAGILCNDPLFWKYLGVNDREEAAASVRKRCGVNSRRDITLDNRAWQELCGRYLAWRMPQVVA